MVNKGRSVYTFKFNCDATIINNLIQSYIQSEGFKLVNKDNEQFYRAGEPMVEGYRYFNYTILGNEINIYAWLKGAFGDVEIEQNNLNIYAMNYRNSLVNLFQEIDKLINVGINNNRMNFDPNTGQPINQNNIGISMNNNGMNFDPNTGQPINNNYVQTQPLNNQILEKFTDATTKKQENMCEYGFWLSLIGLFASFFGVAYGVIVYFFNFYFASQGLKTRKRGKAIATIVISIISILVIMIQLIFL